MKKGLQRSLIVVLALTVFATLVLISRETNNPADFRASSKTTEFIKLSEGWTEYRQQGPTTGETLLLVHGFSVPLFFWEPLEYRLIKKGLHVYSYNQYGRGYSSYPKDAAYDREMYITQLREFMDSMGIDKAHLCGQSMGAALISHFATRYPERVQSISLLSPMLDKVTDNGGITLCRTPIVGCPLTNLLIADIIYKRSKKLVYSCDNVPHEEWLANMRKQAKMKGFRHSLTTLFQTDALETYHSSYTKLGKMNIPTLMITGGQDSSIPHEHFSRIKEALPQVQHTEFPNNNHVVLIQQVDSVCQLLSSFIKTPVPAMVQTETILQ